MASGHDPHVPAKNRPLCLSSLGHTVSPGDFAGPAGSAGLSGSVSGALGQAHGQALEGNMISVPELTDLTPNALVNLNSAFLE